MQNGAEPALSRYLHSKGCRLGLPISGTLELTARCNFDCRMCYVHLTAEEQKKRGAELTADQWLALASDARDAGMMFLLLTGGEPLIRPDFRYILTELKKMGIVVSVNSNASMIDWDMLEFFKTEPPFRFNITLYGGSNETYERLCGRPAFDRVVENIRALREIGIGVKLNASLTPYNCGDLEEILRIGESLAVPVQTAAYMFPPVRRDEGMTGKGDRFTPCQAGEWTFRCDRLRLTDEQMIARAEAMEKGIETERTEDCTGIPGEGISCRAGRASFWLNWLGMMTPCGMMTDPAFSAVELGFAGAWEKTKKAAEAIRLPPECSVCGLKHACHACAAMCRTETGRFDGKPDYICEMTKTTVRLCIEEKRRILAGGKDES